MPDSFVRNLKPVNWVGLWEEPAPQFPEPLLNYWLVTCEKRPSVWAADGHSDDLDLVITAIASQWKDKLSPLSIAFVSRTELNARGLKVEQVPESVPGVSVPGQKASESSSHFVALNLGQLLCQLHIASGHAPGEIDKGGY